MNVNDEALACWDAQRKIQLTSCKAAFSYGAQIRTQICANYSWSIRPRQVPPCWSLGVCFTSYFVFSCIAVLPHSPGVVYYHLLLRRETRIPGVAPFSFRIGIWDLFVHRGQKSYTPTAFGKLWTTPGVRCMQHASS